MSSNYHAVRDHIRDLTGDIDEESRKLQREASKDLAKAREVWEEVAELARGFQLHGTLLDMDDRMM